MVVSRSHKKATKVIVEWAKRELREKRADSFTLYRFPSKHLVTRGVLPTFTVKGRSGPEFLVIVRYPQTRDFYYFSSTGQMLGADRLPKEDWKQKKKKYGKGLKSIYSYPPPAPRVSPVLSSQEAMEKFLKIVKEVEEAARRKARNIPVVSIRTLKKFSSEDIVIDLESDNSGDIVNLPDTLNNEEMNETLTDLAILCVLPRVTNIPKFKALILTIAKDLYLSKKDAGSIQFFTLILILDSIENVIKPNLLEKEEVEELINEIRSIGSKKRTKIIVDYLLYLSEIRKDWNILSVAWVRSSKGINLSLVPEWAKKEVKIWNGIFNGNISDVFINWVEISRLLSDQTKKLLQGKIQDSLSTQISFTYEDTVLSFKNNLDVSLSDIQIKFLASDSSEVSSQSFQEVPMGGVIRIELQGDITSIRFDGSLLSTFSVRQVWKKHQE